MIISMMKGIILKKIEDKLIRAQMPLCRQNKIKIARIIKTDHKRKNPGYIFYY